MRLFFGYIAIGLDDVRMERSVTLISINLVYENVIPLLV
jgi:hypothetical protein